MTDRQGLSIILPALNEAQALAPLVQEIEGYCRERRIPAEIIIVNDGSTDGTAAVADRLAAENPGVAVIHHGRNLGYGKAIRNGFRAARNPYLFYTDADRQFAIRDLDHFWPHVRSGEADVVAGFRIDRQDSRLRRLLSWGFNRLVRMLFGLECRDVDCAYKLLSREAWRRMEITSDDALIDTEMFVKARMHRLRIKQVGVRHFPRQHGTSTVTLVCIIAVLRRLASFRRELQVCKNTETASKPVQAL
ncbi:glycosyltransferase family 2 protein [Thermodesulfobacteriota bacterium]